MLSLSIPKKTQPDIYIRYTWTSSDNIVARVKLRVKARKEKAREESQNTQNRKPSYEY